jgi:hypothetical protein
MGVDWNNLSQLGASHMPKKAKTNHIPLTKVVLYKHGMGYFERCGKIAGPTSVPIFCAAEAIDDMLKSLLVLNLGAGRVGAVTYDSSKTTQMRFEEFGFDIRNSRGLVDLLGQLKGTPVKVTVSGQSITGRVMGLDTVEHIVADKTVREQQLVIYTGERTIKRYNFSSITAISIEDDAVAKEIGQQLELLFDTSKKKDKKRLQIAVEGTANRELFVAYSIPSPIWKTSYRLVFVPDGSLLLQGMAIVDNVQEEDWANVEMTLVSAAPISFIQPLYDPIQPHRRTIAPQGVIASGPVLAERAQQQELAWAMPMEVAATAAAAPAKAQSRAKLAMLGQTQEMAAPGFAGGSPGLAMQAAFAEEELRIVAEPSGELFEYKITRPVTVPHNSSALIPLVQQTIEGERISLYNAEKNSKFPYAAVRMKNTTDLTLEAGPVTVMEEHAYAGEAMLDVLKPNDSRMLPYAIDQGCHVILRSDTFRKPVWRVRSTFGFIYMDYREQFKQIYHIENLSDRKKVVYIEHPIHAGMNLAQGVKPVEATQNHHRFKVQIDAGKKHNLEVIEESDASYHMRIENVEAIDGRQLDWLLQQNYVNKDFLNFLSWLFQERSEILGLLENRRQLESKIAQYKANQERARENIKSLGTTSERYRQAIDEAEDKILQATQELNELNNTISTRERKFVEMMKVELMSELEQEVVQKK